MATPNGQPSASAGRPDPAIPWPSTPEELERLQDTLARHATEAAPWKPQATDGLRVVGVFVVFPRGEHGVGAAGDPAWTGAALVRGGFAAARAAYRGTAAAPYAPGLRALREGQLLERGVEALAEPADVVLVDATGRDHPRGAGLALHLGARLGLPSIGVTDRPLVAVGPDPGPQRGDTAAFVIGRQVVGVRLRTAYEVRPLCVHAAWRTTPPIATSIVLTLTAGARTPTPLREARRIARSARAHEGLG